MGKVIGRKVLVHQTEDGWTVQDLHYGTVRKYKAAAAASRAIARFDKNQADNGISSLTTIEWNTINAVGTEIVKAITEA